MTIICTVFFCACLLACVILNISILYAMLAGLAIYSAYALLRGFSFREVCGMIRKGAMSAKNVLIALLLIGMMTALWRAGGTIPAMVAYSSELIRPQIFVMITFLLNCGVSMLVGSAIGTSATMGIICMTVGRAMGVSPLFTGGAILSGAYFGDRCSPVSTSALLVSSVTGTDLYDNIKRMFRTAVIPFLLTCLVYFLLGYFGSHGEAMQDIMGVFSRYYVIHPAVLIPAAVIIVMALFKADVKLSMSVSIVTAFLITLLVQKQPVIGILKAMVTGYRSGMPEIETMVDGGGIVSMLKTLVIIACSCSYSGIFEGTGLINEFKDAVRKMAEKFTKYGTVFLVSVITSVVGSNQTLAALLTDQLCRNLMEDKKEFAITLEDTVIVIAPLVPWATACTAALAAADAPAESGICACYLYILAVFRLIVGVRRERKKNDSGYRPA